jgi:hypothetical protein
MASRRRSRSSFRQTSAPVSVRPASGGNPALAEEFAQEALIMGLRGLDGFRGEAALLKLPGRSLIARDGANGNMLEPLVGALNSERLPPFGFTWTFR